MNNRSNVLHGHTPVAVKKNFSLFFRISLFSVLLFCKTASTQVITMTAGQLKSACATVPCGDGGLAVNANLYSPSGMTVDQQGNIYIAEFSNHAVRKIDINTGIITTIAGTQRSSCSVAPCGDGGLASAALMNGPRGVAVDQDGHIYIADFSNHAIRKIDKNTGIITTVAGTIRSSCSTLPCGDGGLATSAQLSSPTRVAFDSEGHMYIADYGNHVIRRVDKNTGIISLYAGTMRSSCTTAPCGDGGLATAAQFNGPSSLAFDKDDNLYVTEYGNHTVRKIDRATGIITTLAGNQRLSCSVSPCGDGGPANAPDARLTSPFSLTVGPDNNVYIADASNAAIRKVDLTTGIITTVAGITKSSCLTVPCGNGSLATTAQLSNPFEVKFSPDAQTMYILEYSNQAIRQVSPTNISILPVKISDLKAVREASHVRLSWKAYEETNLQRYEIERSSNRNEFMKIGELPATGAQDYSFLDINPSAAISYYRLKTIDVDGSFQYSEIITSGPVRTVKQLQVSPNPVNAGVMQVQFSNSAQGQVEILMYNSFGQKVFSRQVISNGGIQQESIQLPSHLPAGMYTIYVGNSREELGREKIVIQ